MEEKRKNYPYSLRSRLSEATFVKVMDGKKGDHEPSTKELFLVYRGTVDSSQMDYGG
jgi:hypothetical protein